MSRRNKSDESTSRRKFLKASGAGAVALSLAGCSGGGDGDTPTATQGDGGDGGGSTPSATATATASPTPSVDTATPASDSDGGDGGGGGGIPTGGIFTVGSDQPPKGLNPLATSSAYSWMILDLIYEGGTSVDPVNFEVHPNVYTDWTVENVDSGSPDVFFNVRDGLTFNDGSELSVSDVVFTYNFMMEQKPGRYVSTVSPIQTVEEASNDWDVHMKLSKPIGTYDSNQLAIPILPESVWSNVDDFKTYKPFENGGPIGLGPGVVTTYEPDTAIEVNFNERSGEYVLSDLDWYDDVNVLLRGGPFVDAIRYKIYGSDSALNQAFLGGEVDTMYSAINTSKIDDVESAEGKKIINGFDTGYGHYSFNLRTKPIDDVTFRQALGFAFDDHFWTERLNRGYEIKGDFVMPPGYKAVRPETGSDQKILTGESTNAFDWRASEQTPAIPDIEGIRNFLLTGKVITGESGTYAGKQYPGSLTGVTASQTESKYEYTFGDPVSEVLRNDQNADKEIRVDSKTITEINGGPLVMYVYPAKSAPKTAKMVDEYVSVLRQVGIPVKRQVMSFNTMIGKVYGEEDFDIFPMGWVSLSPFATGTLYNLFHSDNADDHSVAEGDATSQNTSTLLNNPMGYGVFDDASADDLIAQARETMDTQERNELARQAVEQIYLDFPTMIAGYERLTWPVNSADFAGYISNIAGVGDAYLASQLMQVHQK